ncbi:MAG: ATP-dependent helicase [Chloroflexi bacterium]|nr:ATP-dependent helicase [Chloroflexota bacterium]
MTTADFIPRSGQLEVLRYRGGRLAVAAVPGSGKTRTLAALAADLISERAVGPGQEVLIVTMTNSAAENFASQVAGFVTARGLISGVGYRVRTIHGLANDIIRDRSALVGLPQSFPILDEAGAEQTLLEAVSEWLRANPNWFVPYSANQDPGSGARHGMRWRDRFERMVRAYLREAKDLQLSPDEVAGLADESDPAFAALNAANAVYRLYQAALNYQGAVDFADLIRLALEILNRDADYRAVLAKRWPFVLEDESQDSSRLQELLLRRLTETDGNWVRVGDPNQAIYETFTSASPEFLRRFLREAGVAVVEMAYSGRSAEPIIALANRLSVWSREDHPWDELRAMRPLEPPLIRPVPDNDPQRNPAAESARIYLDAEARTPDEERERVVSSVVRAIEADSNTSIAVLVPSNSDGAKMVELLGQRGVPCRELLRTTSKTRTALAALVSQIKAIAKPYETRPLSEAFLAYADLMQTVPSDERRALEQAADRLLSVQPEDVLFPQNAEAFAIPSAVEEVLQSAPGALALLIQFLENLRSWHWAIVLPIDRLLLTVAVDLFREPFQLSVAYSVAGALRRELELSGSASIGHAIAYLSDIVDNRRTVYGIGDDAVDPTAAGVVTVATMHKAKGLEWDRVYLMSVSNYEFPAGDPDDIYRGEHPLVRDSLSLEDEIIAQVQALHSDVDYVEGAASLRARLNYAAERLRLLYVGITRARRELVITTNSGRGQARPAVPLIALENWLRNQ